MKVRAYVEVEVLNADSTELDQKVVDSVLDGLRKYVAYGVHALADNLGSDPAIKYTVLASGTQSMSEKEESI